ncbi:MAG: DUF4174 domain-containing protein [Pseudomonadota bacterium]
MYRSGIFLMGCGMAVSGLSLAAAQADPAVVTLADVQWRHRLLVACDLSASDASLDQLAPVYQMIEADAGERKLRALVITKAEARLGSTASEMSALSQNSRGDLIQQLDCQPGTPTFAVIGLDGGVKQRWHGAAPTPQAVFDLIDAMPMRVREMRDD